MEQVSTEERRLLSTLEQAIERLTAERLDVLPRGLRHRLRRLTASGVLGLPLRTVWDEYAYEVQHGPSALGMAFEITIEPFFQDALSRLSQVEQWAVSITAMLAENEMPSELVIDPDGMRRLLRQNVRSLAIDQDLSWLG